MYVNQCVGCGRLLGNLGPVECPCWRSLQHGATVPQRVRSLQKRVSTVYKLVGRVANDQDHTNAQAVVDVVTKALEDQAAAYFGSPRREVVA